MRSAGRRGSRILAAALALGLAASAAGLFARTASAQAPASADGARQLERLRTALEAGRTAEVIPELTQLASEGSVRATIWLAKVRLEQGRPTDAMALLEGALEAAPHAEALLRDYARAALAGQAPSAAASALERLLHLFPDHGRYAYMLGVTRLQLGDPVAAESALRIATTRLEPPDRALLALGVVQNKLKRFDDARRSLRQSLALEPGEPEAMAGLAEALHGLGELDAAERQARLTLEAAPDHGTGHLLSGRVAMYRGEYEKAATALETAVAVDPEEPRAHYQLGLAYARLGDTEKSKRQLDRYKQVLDAVEAQLTAGAPDDSRAAGPSATRETPQ
ncbi:MAG: tetratricopeptide repeat protein [Acidobacteriota bacterium]